LLVTHVHPSRSEPHASASLGGIVLSSFQSVAGGESAYGAVEPLTRISSTVDEILVGS
jgi:hypothetical protein